MTLKQVPGTRNIVTIRNTDDNFMIADGLYLSPRAGFEINDKCPKEYRMVIVDCINRGWLNPVAYMKQSEYVWEQLQA